MDRRFVPMNYRGSHRHLLRNSKSAMLAAIEIYNKPHIAYRDETFVILLLNAWELVLKALLAKRGERIYYKKRRGEPRRTYALDDALHKAEVYFPAGLSKVAVRRNLEVLSTYRDNSTHFYNRPGFGVLIYGLAQQSILNYVALVRDALGDRFAADVTWHLLPLGLTAPTGPIEYMEGVGSGAKKGDAAVRTFIAEIARAVQDVNDAGEDVGQVMTSFKVSLQSVKKIANADAVVGVEAGSSGTGAPIAIVRREDPNVSHPLSRADVVKQLGKLHARYSSEYVFQAIAWKRHVYEDRRFCWVTANGAVRQYSPEVVSMVRKLSAADIDAALKDYRARPQK